MIPLYVLLLFDGLLLAAGWLFSYSDQQALSQYVFAALLVLLSWQFLLYKMVSPARTFRIRASFRTHHFVQTSLQLCLYIYWGLYWLEVGNYVPLLMVQLIFAYLFEMLLSWSRGKDWHVGFGQFPIVLSLNLFLWFREEYFYLQFLLVALTYLGKEFVTWTQNGKRKHIFNPSGFSLSLVSVGLMFAGAAELTRGVDIITAFVLTPSFYEVVFLLGLVVMLLFRTTLVTFGATLALCLLYWGAGMLLGRPLFLVPIDTAVFLGITLLVTDPSSSPKTDMGKLFFGLIYGTGIFFTHIMLRYLGQPGYFDKILMVPVVNLLAPTLDRVSAGLMHRIGDAFRLPTLRYHRFGWVTFYAAFFIFILPSLKDPPPSFKSPLPGSVVRMSNDLGKMLYNSFYCRQAYPDAYKPFGFSREIAQYRTLTEIYRGELRLQPNPVKPDGSTNEPSTATASSSSPDLRHGGSPRGLLDGIAGAVTSKARERWAQQRDGLDPAQAGWESEAFAENVNSQLKRIGEMVLHPAELDESRAERIASQRFSCGPLRPHETQRTFEDSTLRVESGIIDVAAVRTQPAGTHRGTAGLVEALRSLGEPFRGADDLRFKFKLFQIEPGDDSVLTRQYFTLSGQAPDGTIEQNATWLIRWVTEDDREGPRIDWMGVEQYEQAMATTGGAPWFADCTQSVLGGNESYRRQLRYGVNHWVERIESANDFHFFEHTGLTVGDANGDGLEDVYVCQQGGLPNRLYLQQPDGTAQDASAESGVDLLDLSYSALLVDLDNDGHQDLVVSTPSYLLMFEGDGQGRFTPRTHTTPGRGFSISAADYDLDGDLDIYATVYYASREETISFPIPAPYHDAKNGGRNFFIRNEGNWEFSNATVSSGLDVNNTRFSFSAAWEDYDNDGDVDLYVANDFGPNNLFRNDGGKFIDVAGRAGAEDGAFGMSVSWSDYNHDGWMDIYVANMFSAAGNRVTYQRNFKPQATAAARSRLQHTARGNTLFENAGDGTFHDVSVEAGVTMGRWGWASLFADLNNDSWDDLVLANGYITGSQPGDL